MARTLLVRLPCLSRARSLVLMIPYTVELQWLEHFWDCENMFETGIDRANVC